MWKINHFKVSLFQACQWLHFSVVAKFTDESRYRLMCDNLAQVSMSTPSSTCHFHRHPQCYLEGVHWAPLTSLAVLWGSRAENHKTGSMPENSKILKLKKSPEDPLPIVLISKNKIPGPKVPRPLLPILIVVSLRNVICLCSLFLCWARNSLGINKYKHKILRHSMLNQPKDNTALRSK